MTTDQGGAGRAREPGEATRLRVPGGAEGGRSQNEADRLMARDGVKGSEARGGATRSSSTGAADGFSTSQQGISKLLAAAGLEDWLSSATMEMT